MAKVLLVMDAPECCKKCDLVTPFSNPPEMYWCNKEQRHVNDKGKGIPDWCPLIPEPERMSEKNGFFPLPEDMQMQAIGWNACLDTIEGKAEQ